MDNCGDGSDEVDCRKWSLCASKLVFFTYCHPLGRKHFHITVDTVYKVQDSEHKGCGVPSVLAEFRYSSVNYFDKS